MSICVVYSLGPFTDNTAMNICVAVCVQICPRYLAKRGIFVSSTLLDNAESFLSGPINLLSEQENKWESCHCP